MKGAEALIQVLEDMETEVIFGYPGGANLPIYDALYRSKKIEHILARHEQGASLMADGYARAANRPGVCLATSGPGTTNLLTGVANAFLDSIPMLALTGQIPLSFVGTDAFQEVDCFNMSMHITKHNELVTDAAEIVPAMRSAYLIANTGRKGPVLLDFPKDVMLEESNFDLNKTRRLQGYQPNTKGHIGQIKKMVRALKISQTPLAILGGGIINSGAEEAVRQFLKMAQLPAVRTLMGKGVLDETDPLYLGMLGTHGSIEGNKAVKNTDLIICLGTRFSDRTTMMKRSNFAKNAKIVHIDIDPAEIGKTVRADIPIVGDIQEVIADALPILEKILPRKKPWHSTNNLKTILYSNDHAYCIELVLNELNKIDEALYVSTDVGRHQMWATHCSINPKHRPFLTSGGLGTMGYGLPAAIGAWFYKRDRPAVNISGDGSFLMNLQEFTLAVEMNIPLVVVIINDYRLGMIRELQNASYGKRHIAHDFNRHTDYEKLAQAFGGQGFTVRSPEKIYPILKKAIDSGKPTLIDFNIEKIAEAIENKAKTA